MRKINSFLAIIACVFPVSLLGDGVAPTHGISLFGDLKYPEDFTHFDYVNPNALKGGLVKLGAFGSFDSFNPFIPKGMSATRADLLHCTLLEPSQDEPLSFYGYLAEKVEIAPDHKSVTFTLNKNAKFSDGTPVTADDVIFSFHTLLEKGLPIFAQYYHDVEKAEKIDPLKVKFYFKTDKNRELPLILGTFPIFSKAYHEQNEFEKAHLLPPVGCGPYQIKDFTPGQSVTYTRIPEWWGENLPSQKGIHNFDMTYVYYRDQTVLFEAFKGGEYDFRSENIAKNWATSYNIPAVQEGKVILKETLHNLPTGMQICTFNTRKPIFKDRKVREALTKAFNFEWLNKTLFFNSYTRSLSYFSNSPLACSGIPEGEELKILEPFKDQLPAEVFTHPFTLPVAHEAGHDRKLATAASALLEEAGWVIKNGKRVNGTTGEPFTFEFLLFDPAFEKVALALQRNLSALGIQMHIRTLTPSQYVERLRKHEYDMIVSGIPQTETPGNEQRIFWSSQAANIPDSRNFAGIQDPVVDKLVDLVIASPDREHLIHRVKALDRVLLWGYYGIPQWHLATSRIAYWNKFGMPDKKPKDGVGFDTWWVVDGKK